MIIRDRLALVTAVVSSVVIAASSVAYAEDGVITGQVRNAATKAPIPDVVITVTSPALQGEQIVVTDAGGNFRVAQIPPGDGYAVSADGGAKFKPSSRGGITLTSGSTVRVNIELLPENAGIIELTVAARAPVVDVGTSRIATPIDASMMRRLAAGASAPKMGGSIAAASPTITLGAAPIPKAVLVPGGMANAQSPTGIRTGEWDDNANFREFSRWIASEPNRGASVLDTSVRRFIVVRDSAGKGVPSCRVDIREAQGKTVELLTTSNGRAIFFPRAENIRGTDFVATAHCQQVSVSRFFLAAAGDGIVDLQLSTPQVLPSTSFIDVAFVLDTTGSMSEEIHALQDTLEVVAKELGKIGIRPRVGLVEYRDRGDEFVTRTYPMTTDVDNLQKSIANLKATGGGDTPEHVNEALRVAVRSLDFRPESIARLVFLIGDAPPHLDYANDEGYINATREANHRGIQIFSIAASGMDPLGQFVFRQIAQYTGGTHLFVLRGGAGPQSTGGGDPRSSCGGTHTDYKSDNLDTLILSKVRAAIAARKADPLRIAGLHQDDKDLPCDQRIVMWQ